MSDYISRQAAIEVIDAVFPVDPMKSEYVQGIACGAALAKTYVEQLPSAQPQDIARDIATIIENEKDMRVVLKQPRWIPCSERLPDANDCPMDCLVTRKGKFIGNYTDIAVCERNGTWTHEDWDAIVLGDVENGKTTGLISTRDDDIIAWMPLPEPYKGEES